MTDGEVFMTLVGIMNSDNNADFKATHAQAQRARGPIMVLQKMGYFADNPEDLDGSFWQAAAGEESEAKEYFAKAPKAYADLLSVLEEIFLGEGSDRR